MAFYCLVRVCFHVQYSQRNLLCNRLLVLIFLSCRIVVDDLTVMTLISDPRVKLKYQHLITNSFVQCNRLLRWCPSPDCSNAIKVSVLHSTFEESTIICASTVFKFGFGLEFLSLPSPFVENQDHRS
jgi:IBR domain, a half RING-finger domain